MLTLIQFNPDERQKPQTFHLKAEGTHIIGRRHGDVQLLDSRISRQHAEASVQNGTWVIRDLSSSNGTWVNGERIEGLCELEEGDRLVVGRITLIVGHVDVSDSANPAAAVGGPAVASKPAEEAMQAAVDEDDADLEALDLDAVLDLEPIDFDFDEEVSGDVAAENTGIEIAEAMASTPGETAGLTDDGPEAAADRDDDLLDLSGTAEHRSVDPGESSLAPASTTQEFAAPPTDETDEEDEYAAAVHFVTPTTRPDSPLDSLDASDDEAINATAADESDDFDYEDDAPPIVGLSLDLPGPDAELAAGENGEGDSEIDPLIEGDAAALEDWLDEDEAQAQRLAADVEASAQDTGLDHELEHDTGDANDATPVSTAASSGATPASVTTESADPREPDLVDSEDQQELEPAWSSKGSSRKKGLLALVLLALAAGGGFWMINSSGTDTPIAGVTPGTNATAPAVDHPGATAAPNPRNTAATPVQDVTTPVRPAVGATPSPEVAVAAGDAPTGSQQSNAFGQAPTLAAPTPRTTPTPTPPIPAAAPTEIATAEPTPSSAEKAPSVPDPTGPTLALLDPTPTPDPLLTIRPSSVTDLPDQAMPAAIVPARRIVFVVDASGSMVDSMNQGALTWLEKRLESLTDQDEFTVLFFRSNEVIEVPPLGLKSADSLNRDRTLAWVSPNAGNIRPRGKSEPLIALQQAQGYQPTDIYILSDDMFGQRRAAAAIEARDLEPLLGTTPATVHTVQFFHPTPEDSRLEDIALRFGGTYEFVEEPLFDLDPNNDLGVDLLGISR